MQQTTSTIYFSFIFYRLLTLQLGFKLWHKLSEATVSLLRHVHSKKRDDKTFFLCCFWSSLPTLLELLEYKWGGKCNLNFLRLLCCEKLPTHLDQEEWKRNISVSIIIAKILKIFDGILKLFWGLWIYLLKAIIDDFKSEVLENL